MSIAHRFVIAVALCAVVSAGTAHAAAGPHVFTSKTFGFSLRYSTGWLLSYTNPPVDRRLVLTHAGKTQYSLTVLVLPMGPAATIRGTLTRVAQYEASRGTGNYLRLKWVTTSLAHRPALGAVMRVSTEGGVGLANGIYVAASATHVYEITLVLFGSRAPSNPDRFPAAYHQILSTLKYL